MSSLSVRITHNISFRVRALNTQKVMSCVILTDNDDVTSHLESGAKYVYKDGASVETRMGYCAIF